MHMFRKAADFEAVERVMVEAHQREPIRILANCILSNHWQFVVWPERDGQPSHFFRWLAHTHAVRWCVSHRTVGYVHLHQARFKELGRVRVSVERGRPYGDDEWVRQTVKAINLEHTDRREGRPRKANRSVTDSAG
jgi:REP element-mobilizing transposase RayT